MTNIKVQIDARQDGRYTATVKLIGWDLTRFRALISNMSMMPYGKRIAQELGSSLVDVLEEQKVAAAELAAEEPSIADDVLEETDELEEEQEAVKEASGSADKKT